MLELHRPAGEPADQFTRALGGASTPIAALPKPSPAPHSRSGRPDGASHRSQLEPPRPDQALLRRPLRYRAGRAQADEGNRPRGTRFAVPRQPGTTPWKLVVERRQDRDSAKPRQRACPQPDGSFSGRLRASMRTTAARKRRSTRSLTRPAAVSSYRRPDASRQLRSSPSRSQRRRTSWRITSPAGCPCRTRIWWAVRRERSAPHDTDSKTANSTTPSASTGSIHQVYGDTRPILSGLVSGAVRATQDWRMSREIRAACLRRLPEGGLEIPSSPKTTNAALASLSAASAPRRPTASPVAFAIGRER